MTPYAYCVPLIVLNPTNSISACPQPIHPSPPPALPMYTWPPCSVFFRCLCSLFSRFLSCAGNPELVMLVPDVAKSKRLNMQMDESEALKPMLQFAFRCPHRHSPSWGIITLRWASHNRRYVSNCEIDMRRQQSKLCPSEYYSDSRSFGG